MSCEKSQWHLSGEAPNWTHNTTEDDTRAVEVADERTKMISREEGGNPIAWNGLHVQMCWKHLVYTAHPTHWPLFLGIWFSLPTYCSQAFAGSEKRFELNHRVDIVLWKSPGGTVGLAVCDIVRLCSLRYSLVETYLQMSSSWTSKRKHSSALIKGCTFPK